MRGRKPKPTALKALAGNPGQRRLNDQEPEIEVKQPPCPNDLSEDARAIWDQTAPILISMKVLTEADWANLAIFSIAMARLLNADKMNRKLARAVNITLADGTSEDVVFEGVIRTKNGNLQVSPFDSMLRAYMQIVNRVAGDLGMSPSMRSRLRTGFVNGKETEKDKFFK